MSEQVVRLDGGQWDMLAQYVIGHRPSGKRQAKKLVAIHNGIREVLNRHEYWFAVPDIGINLKTETLELILTVVLADADRDGRADQQRK